MGSSFKNGPLARFGNAFAASFSGGPRGTPGLPIAISFGVGSLKILQVNPGNPPALVAAACLDTPRELMHEHRRRLDFQMQALPRLVKHGGFKGKRAVCMIPSWQVFCKHLQFARQDGVPLAALVDAAIPAQLNADPSSVVYRFIEVGADKPGPKVEAVVIATPRDLVDRLMKGMMGCKLEPVGMHSEFVAGLRAFDHVHRREGDLESNTLYLDIGTGTTKVMISHGTMLAFARVIEIGGRHIDELVAKQLNVDIETAHQQRLATGQTVPPAPVPAVTGVRPVLAGSGGAMVGAADALERRVESPVLPGFTQEVLSQPEGKVAPEACDLTEPLEMLTDEVLMCLRYHASQFPGRKVERAVFIGGEARHRGLCQHIARALKLPSQMADPLARVARTGKEPAVGVDLKQPQPGWAAVLGLCLSPTDL